MLTAVAYIINDEGRASEFIICESKYKCRQVEMLSYNYKKPR